MPRVIQDSDDESDDVLGIDVHQATEDASPKHSTSDASSTEALRRQIEAAHRAHLQSQFPVHDCQLPAPLEANDPKGKLPAGTETNSAPNRTYKHPPATQKATLNGITSSLPNNQQQDQNFGGRISNSAETSKGADWVLEGSMRDAYAQHNPDIMFPEPSSTVPNATLTQQRMMEGVHGPALLGSEIDSAQVLFEPNASIPWSEYLKSPTNTLEHARSSGREPHVSQTTSAAFLETSPNEHLTPVALQQGLQEPLMLTGSPPPQYTHLDIVYGQECTMLPKHDLQPEATKPLPQDTSFSTIENFAERESASSTRKSHKKRINSNPGPTSDDDLADSGQAKKQPNPCRSQPTILNVDTEGAIDYLIRTQQPSKAKRRRKSTPEASNLVGHLCTPKRLRQICEMGFTPSTSARALQENNGDVTQTFDWLISNRFADDDLVSYISPTSKAGNNKPTESIYTPEHNGGFQTGNSKNKRTLFSDVGATLDAMESHTTFAETDTVAYKVSLRSPSKVQVIIPAKLLDPPGEPSPKRVRCRKTSLGPPELTSTENTVKSVEIEKKRGRGRPRKAARAPTSTSIMQQGGDEGPEKHTIGSEVFLVEDSHPISVQDQENMATANVNTTFSEQGGKSAESGNAKIDANSKRSTPEPEVLPQPPEVEPITPDRVKKATPREQPSSNRAKMTYRVGLSKRARIAPLLRTLKK